MQFLTDLFATRQITAISEIPAILANLMKAFTDLISKKLRLLL